MTTEATPAQLSFRPPSAAVVLAAPLAGLALLLARPELDMEWQHHPSHFWLVLLTAAVNVALGYVTNVAATRHRDARLLLVSLAFIASAGFLGLHALATPGVLLDQPNVGFAVATPVGLCIASVFAALSVSPLAGPRGSVVVRNSTLLLVGLFAAMVAWGVVSVAGLRPLNGPPPGEEAAGVLDVFAGVAVGLFAFAAWRYVGLYRRRGGIVPIAVASAFVLLGEAMIAIALSRNWHLSWWEWHVLMLVAFLTIALAARHEYRTSGSLTGAFGGLYLEATLGRIDRWHGRAIAAVAQAEATGSSTEAVLADLRAEGASAEEAALLAEAAGELRRLDELFRPYLPANVAQRLRGEPDATRLGGEEREVSVLFADLANFTTFSETRAPTEVIAMLNAYWAVVVPVIDGAGGVVEYFAGDGVLAFFNALGDQPDHPARAARAGLSIVDAAAPLAAANPDWPIFRVGVNTGPAVVGNVGAADRRSFTVIGDTTNVAARLMAAGDPGQVVVADATWQRLGVARDGTALGPTQVKGKREPVIAWVVRGVGESATAPSASQR
ncbi:MAG: adenylate/guanylate cyclase domain-containing protein [Chloroflexota bacterium]